MGQFYGDEFRYFFFFGVLCVQRLMGEMQKLDESRQHEVSMWKV
jgi:hypothetical protein